jgi:hypothetical protein
MNSTTLSIATLLLAFSLLGEASQAAPPTGAPRGFTVIAPVKLVVTQVSCDSGANVNALATMNVGDELPFTDGFMISSLKSKNDRLELVLAIDKSSYKDESSQQPACPLGDVLRISFSKK